MKIERYSENSKANAWRDLRVFPVLLLLLTGCTSTPTLTQISTFGAATTSLADDTNTAFHMVNSATIERKIYGVANESAAGPDDSTFEGLLSNNAMATRVAAIAQLGLYGEGLKKLAEADVRSEVDSAATDLNGALNGLAATLDRQAEAQAAIGVITAAINAIGQEIVDSKKRAAIKEVIEQSDKYVQGVGAIVAEEARLLGPVVELNVNQQNSELRQQYDKLIETNASPDKRRSLMGQMWQTYDTADTIVPFFNSVAGGAENTMKAHSELVSAVDSDFSTAEALAAISRLLQSAIKTRELLDQMQEDGGQ